MFEDYEDENEEEQGARHICGSIEDLRDHVLMVFAGFIAKMQNEEPTEAECCLDYQRQFLAVWEVEQIVRELSDVQADGAYGIGANSFEEYKTKMLRLFRALGARVLSNIMRVGVQRGFLDAEYDCEKNDFNFSITEKGMELVNSINDSNDADGGETSRSGS
jgi:hypothetical protein